MPVSFSEESYKNYGKCLKISNDTAELYVTLELGPRIIRYALKNGGNVFFEDTERKISNSAPFIKDVYGKDAVWYIYGGHRLWLSPEAGYSYYPDNGAVSYKILDSKNGATFTYGVQKATGLELEIRVEMDSKSSDAKVTHTVTNRSGKSINCAPWALSVLDKGGIEIIPFNDRNTGLLANRNLILWPYTDMSDSRVFWGKKYITLQHSSSAAVPFKIGLDLQKGWAAYINKEVLFIKRFKHYEDGVYPDNGCSFETYSCADFQEIETVGQLVTLTPDASVIHSENWSLIGNVKLENGKNEDAVSEFAQRNIL